MWCCRSRGAAYPLTASRSSGRVRASGSFRRSPAKRIACGALFGSLATLCATVANDDARLTVGIEGPRARDTLAKMLTIDLDERAFRPGDAAVTVAAGISVYVWLREDAPVFECAVPRSFAPSFWDWLVGSAAEYGCAVAPA